MLYGMIVYNVSVAFVLIKRLWSLLQEINGLSSKHDIYCTLCKVRSANLAVLF